MNRPLPKRVLTGAPVLFACVFALAMSSCIAESLQPCGLIEIPLDHNVDIRIRIDYEMSEPTPPDSRVAAPQEWYDGKIESVSLLIFDEQKRYVGSWEGGAYTLGHEYVVPLNLPEGQAYTFVAWTNRLSDWYEFSHWGNTLTNDAVTWEPREEPLTSDDITMNLIVPEDESRDHLHVIGEDLPFRHHGLLQSAAVFDETNLTTHTIVLTSHTYKINYILRGLSPAGNDGEPYEYEVELVDYNSRHKLIDREVIIDENTEPYYHIRTFEIPEGEPDDGTDVDITELVASMNLLQIGDDTGDVDGDGEPDVTSFRIVNKTTGEVVYPKDDTEEDQLLALIKAYAEATNEGLMSMLNRRYEYTFEFNYGTVVDLEVIINGWVYRDNSGTLGR